MVGLHQLVLVETKGLSRWKGGGFGMYSEFSYPTRQLWYRYINGAHDVDYAMQLEASPFHSQAYYVNLEKQLRSDQGDGVSLECWSLSYDPSTYELSRTLQWPQGDPDKVGE